MKQTAPIVCNTCGKQTLARKRTDVRARYCSQKCSWQGNKATPLSLQALADMYWDRVERGRGCWLWGGGRGGNGYGILRRAEKSGFSPQAHRLSWIFANGAIPQGKYVLHTCDTPLCVNPSHLFLGSQRDNALDMVKKGRGRHKTAYKLSVAKVKQIRHLYAKGTRQMDLATRFNVSQPMISLVVRRQEYAWV
jgi:hypothetical protein